MRYKPKLENLKKGYAPALKGRCSVYLIGSTDGYVKVGVSSNVDKRFSSIKSAVPFGVFQVFSVDLDTRYDALCVEYYTHKYLKRFCATGEWFTCKASTASKALEYVINQFLKYGMAHEMPMGGNYG